MKRFATMLLLTLTTAGLAAQTPAVPKELTPLQGFWVITTANGQDVAGSGTEVALNITGDKYEQWVNGQVTERGLIKVTPPAADAAKKPLAIDLLIKEGDDANKTQLGVMEISGNTMTCKLNTPGVATRPTDFAPADGFFVMVATKRKD